MNKELKGLCLCMGLMGLAYVVLLVILALLTSAKIIKTIFIVASLSLLLISIGLSPRVKSRLKQKFTDVLH